LSAFEPLLFVHLLGFGAMAGGTGVAGAALAAARRRKRADEIALLLGLTRIGVLLIGLGALAVLVSGFWLIDVTGHGLDEGWVSGALGLLTAAAVFGAFGGQAPKRARMEAERSARERRLPGPEFERNLKNRWADLLNGLAAGGLITALALMVWKPGG
jgi:uncharacterized membrane protein